MVDLREFINGMIAEAAIPEKAIMRDITAFFIDNNWFGYKPVFSDGKALLDEKQVAVFTEPLRTFLSEPMQSDYLIDRIAEVLPLTAKQLTEFFEEENLPENVKFYLADFLLYHLKKDIVLYSDNEIAELLQCATMELIKAHGDCLTFFMAWLRANTKTAYYRDYTMDKRYTMDVQNQAYEFDEYLELLYYLFNEEYIAENEMYQRAAESKNYTDTWLYLSMHFICSLRYTDLQRIYHPDLPYSAEEVIQKIYDNTFTANDAKMVLLSITTRMCLLPFTPSKTEAASGIGSVKFHVPTSCEVHFGKLFALAEAHRQLDGVPEMPIIRKITSYAEITRYMGEEIGGLFLESNFRSRSATKSYLQSIYMLTDDVLEENNDGPSMKGYILAALARSHKGSYGEFATTTFEYLKDAKFSGLTPEFVMFELFERGVLSFIASTLLKMVTNEEYSRLTVQKQTELVKALALSPHEIESVVAIVDRGKSQAEMVVREVVCKGTDIMAALHRIGSGEAFSKQPDSLCLLSAVNRLCPYSATRQCIGCKYEIGTKSTLYLLIDEVNRMRRLYQTAQDKREKEKYLMLLKTVIVPKLDEMLYCIRNNYGEEVFEQYERLIRERMNEHEHGGKTI